MIICEDKQLAEDFFEQIVPKYAKICGDDEFPKSHYYSETLKITQAESDEKLKLRFNHELKSVVLKRFNEYFDEKEIEEKFIILLKNTTQSRGHWCWCGLQPGTEAQKNFVPEPNNTHFNISYQVYIEPKIPMNLVGEMEMFDKMTF